MTAKNNIVLFATLLAGLLLAACAGSDANQLGLEGTQWQLASAGDMTASDLPVTVTLSFDMNMVSGHAGCNQFGGEYRANAQNGTISFDQIASTLMACEDEAVMQMEAEYLAALNAAERYELDGDRLTIHYNGNALVFARSN